MTYSINDMTVAGRTTQRGVRLWEMHNLLGHVARDEQGRRMYTPEQLHRVSVIAAAQMAGMSLAEIKRANDATMYGKMAEAILFLDAVRRSLLPPVPEERVLDL